MASQKLLSAVQLTCAEIYDNYVCRCDQKNNQAFGLIVVQKFMIPLCRNLW